MIPSLSRNSSYVRRSSFTEDWEAFPPLDKLTIFDFLENLALPQRLEKLQSTLSAHTLKVRRQSERIKNQSAKAKDRVREEWRRRIPPTADEQLDKYRKKMSEGVDRLGRRWNDAKVVTVREKVAFIGGVLNIFISAYLIGAWPEWFHIWYTAQLCYFLPLRYYTYHQKGYHYFMADLCYFVNVLAMAMIWVFPQSRRLFVATYCLAYGNNAWAIAMWRNSMVFHSIDKVTRYVRFLASHILVTSAKYWLYSLFIHIMPPVTLHCLVHLVKPSYQAARFPGIYSITSDSSSYSTLLAMLLWSSLPYALWQIAYHIMITVRRRAKIQAGRPTSFTWLRKSYASTSVGKVILALPEVLQEPTFMVIQYLYAVLTMLPCGLWLHYRWASAGFLMVVFIWSIQNGATYYIDVFGKRFEKDLAKLKAEMEEWKRDPERLMAHTGSNTPILTPTPGVVTASGAGKQLGGDADAGHLKKNGLDSIPSLETKLASSIGSLEAVSTGSMDSKVEAENGEQDGLRRRA